MVAVRELAVGALAGAALAAALLPLLRSLRLRARVPRGRVFLVGAGPGDAELLTLKARRLLAAASVAVVDDLVGAGVRALLPRGCEVVHVGKRGGRKDSARQEDIDALLVARSRAGHVVVRLKGGDPMVFGRVHSEIRALARAGCAFEVVPGISSALAAPSVVNIPVTHKLLSRSFLVVSGHKPAEMDFRTLASVDTLLVLMATRTLPAICAGLIDSGRPGDTPVALVHSGTNPDQLTVLGTLQDMPDRIAGRSLSPAIVVVGAVAKFANLEAYLEEADEAVDEQNTIV